MSPDAPSHATARGHRPPASAEKSRPTIFWPLAGIIVPLFSVLAKIEVLNPEKLPREGAYILAPNHNSEIDPLVIAVAVWRMGRAPRFMAKESLFGVPVLGWVLRATGMIPVARTSSAAAARDTIKAAQHLARSGRGVIVYPEGSLTRDPGLWPMRGKTGAVRLAMIGGIPLIPMAQWGSQQIMPRYGRLRLWPLRRRIRVIVGDPLDPALMAKKGSSNETLIATTDVLMGQISALLADLREETPPLQRWDPGAHGQNETGRLEP